MTNPQPKDSFLDELDEHDQPTEPMFPAIASPSTPTSGTEDLSIPAPQPYERPFPAQGKQSVVAGPTGSFPGTPAYPQLPPTSVGGNGWGRPAGGVIPTVPTQTPTPPAPSIPRRSPWPILLGLFFVAVQLLLLARFVLKIINWPASTTWVNTVYSVSTVFVLPFQLLWKNLTLPIPIPGSLELYTVLAVLTYMLLSRLLVRVLKALLHSR
jgi:hypothetical protein